MANPRKRLRIVLIVVAAAAGWLAAGASARSHGRSERLKPAPSVQIYVDDGPEISGASLLLP
jgi:hypothetical protein